MRIAIKQNWWNAAWQVKPLCDASRLLLSSDPDRILTETWSTRTITTWLGVDWMARYMHGGFGTNWIEVEVEPARIEGSIRR